MTNEQIIRDAISRSISRNEIVHCEINGGDIHDLVSSTVSQDWDYSQENRDDQGREVLDVYSTDDYADQWRIKVTIDVQNQIVICGSPIEYDPSGVGHAWTAATEADCFPSIQEEIACEMIDGGQESCENFRASNGVHYRW